MTVCALRPDFVCNPGDFGLCQTDDLSAADIGRSGEENRAERR